MRGSLRLLAILILVQLLIFVVSLPGLGVETRTPSQYAPWAGPIFLLLTILVFALGIAALLMLRYGAARTSQLALGQAIVAIATNAFDFSHVGGPAPPIGPTVLGLIAIVIAVLEIVFAGRLLMGEPASADTDKG
jgi:hypothetical protein